MVAESVTINSVNLTAFRAWNVRDYTPLYGRGTARGTDTILAGVDGELARPRLRGAWRFTLPMFIFGHYDGQTSLAASDPRVTLGDNIDYLRAQLLAPYAGSTTVTLTHTRQDAAQRTAAVICESLQLSAHDGPKGLVVRALLAVTVPAGQLTDV